MFRDLAADAGAANPTMLATPLQLIYEGAGLAGRMDRRLDVAGTRRGERFAGRTAYGHQVVNRRLLGGSPPALARACLSSCREA